MMEVPQEDLVGWAFRRIVRNAGLDPDENHIFSITVGNGWSTISYWPKNQPLERDTNDPAWVRRLDKDGPGIEFNWAQES